MRLAKFRGDAREMSSASFASFTFPRRTENIESIGFQYGGMLLINVFRFDGPTMSTEQANTSGVYVSAASAQYPP